MSHRLDRRSFLKHSTGALVAWRAALPVSAALPTVSVAPEFRTSNTRWQAAYDAALTVLAGNVRTMPHIDQPVLIEGSVYQGIWMECGPLEALVYRRFRPDVARASHMTFFKLQRPDGQLPANNKLKETGFGQIQMVVPIAASAWELARATGDDELLRATYKSCSAWDAWLMKFRNTRGTGLVEAFCTYDTGMDNSRRFAGIGNQCPNKDAKQVVASPGMPRLCPDLSATVYGQRVALAAMARALGKNSEADSWDQSAVSLRALIVKKLYVPDEAAFYDIDAQGKFVRINCCTLMRMCSEHVPDQALFDELWMRQIHNPKAFWAPFPLPSVALDDPLFVRPIPRNSWGGAAQALTALRAPRWFDHYLRPAEFSFMMDRWCEAIQRDIAQHGVGFRQQFDPLTGDFTQADPPGYSPCALVMLDYTWRLAGIVEDADTLQWNIRPGHPATQSATFRMRTDAGFVAALHYRKRGAEVSLAGKPVGRIERGIARLVTDKEGKPREIIGISESTQSVSLNRPGQKTVHVTLSANQRISL